MVTVIALLLPNSLTKSINKVPATWHFTLLMPLGTSPGKEPWGIGSISGEQRERMASVEDQWPET